MHPALVKSFGGLSLQRYIRHFLFGLIFPAIFFWAWSHGNSTMPVSIILFFTINSLLYPYSRFVYEGIVGYILGENVFFVNAIVMLIFKYMTMAVCWACAMFIAPVGLLYLYLTANKRASE
ncbi:hypothetical protein [Cupriavidus alkaliphilus]|uniref:hypothetical protein n=1 Tax=Cupriavidus alkaliphilus TaxID=942866 RepID=UPI001619EF12|nr:hypothetical protein [Cupriavidus alkaliphilus]MBB2916445.1 hypothetical protein [Cupriavidus alkaliphilus]